MVKAGKGRREGRKAFLSFSLLASTVKLHGRGLRPPEAAAAAAVALVAAANMAATATMVHSGSEWLKPAKNRFT